MQSPGDAQDKGEKEVGVATSKDLSNSPDSVSLEAANEDPKTNGLTRKLLIKLDTRCVSDLVTPFPDPTITTNL